MVDGGAALAVVVLKVVDVGEGDDATLSGEPGVSGESGEDSGLGTASSRMATLRVSAMDCPRRVPRLVIPLVLAYTI